MKFSTYKSRLALGAALLLSSMASYAASIGTMATTATSSLDPVLQFGTGVLFVIGIFVFGGGILMFKKAAASNGQMSYMMPIMAVVVGAGLIFMPALINNVAGTGGLDGGAKGGIGDTSVYK